MSVRPDRNPRPRRAHGFKTERLPALIDRCLVFDGRSDDLAVYPGCLCAILLFLASHDQDPVGEMCHMLRLDFEDARLVGDQ